MKLRLTTTRPSKKSAFTLIEMLIALTVFVIFLTATRNIYIFLSQTVNDIQTQRLTYTAAQDTFEFFNETFRNGIVDYPCYQNTDGTGRKNRQTYCESKTLNGKQDIVIRDQDSTKRTIIQIEPDGKDAKKFVVIRQTFDKKAQQWGPIQPKELTFPEGVSVTNAEFIVTPSYNLFSKKAVRDNYYQFHPKVTVLMDLQTIRPVKGPITTSFQTTISSRVYNRF